MPVTALQKHGRQGLRHQHHRRNWNYLNQALQFGLRQRTIKTNPAAGVLLPPKRLSKPRKSFTIGEAQRLLAEAIPADPRPAMWLTPLMCGLRPGERASLRWRYVDLSLGHETIDVVERAMEIGDRYVGQAAPKTPRSRRIAALVRRYSLELEDDT